MIQQKRGVFDQPLEGETLGQVYLSFFHSSRQDLSYSIRRYNFDPEAFQLPVDLFSNNINNYNVL